MPPKKDPKKEERINPGIHCFAYNVDSSKIAVCP